eukprot:319055_1
MAHSLVDLNVNYISQNENEQNNNFLSNQMKWFNKWALYLPLWSAASYSHKKRSVILNIIMLTFVIVAIAANYGIDLYNLIDSESEYSPISTVVWISMLFLSIISRFISVYYFYFLFDWPWNYQSSSCYDKSGYDGYDKKIVKKYNLVIRVMYILFICIDIATIVGHYNEFNNHLNTYIDFVVGIVFRIFILYPQFILVIIQSIVFIKYYLHLSQISNKIRDEHNIELQMLFDQYDKLRKQFQYDNTKWLQIAVQAWLTTEMLYAWNTIYYEDVFIKNQIWRQVLNVLKSAIIFIIYVSCASLLTECHQKFMKILWLKGNNYIITNDGNLNDKLCFTYTLQYVQQHPVKVTIGRFAVSKENTIKFFFIFVLTKVASFAVSKTLNDNYGH